MGSFWFLLVGFVLGPAVTKVLELHPLRELAMLETVTEIALLIALFTVGVKLRVPIGDWRWSLPLRLASISMMVTIAGLAAAASWLFGFPPGLALALGAALAPTDPVFASEVQLRSPQDRDALRFGLTGEGGLNDGTAFPFVLLGLGLMGLHDLGEWGSRWLIVDLLWGTVTGLGVGFAIGDGVALAALLFLVIRPLSVWLGLLEVPAGKAPRRLLGWFGIRGIDRGPWHFRHAADGAPPAAPRAPARGQVGGVGQTMTGCRVRSHDASGARWCPGRP